MTPIFKPGDFEDEWILPEGSAVARFLRLSDNPLSWVLSPLRGKRRTFTNYVLGFRVDPTEREMDLVQANNMFPQTFVNLDQAITFADVFSPEWVPVINPNQKVLLAVEAQVRAACVTWTRFFESMTGAGF